MKHGRKSNFSKSLSVGIAAFMLISLISVMIAVPASAEPGNTLNVPSAEYPTIQAAINAANPDGGDTINVAAGTYTEIGQIVIDKNLSIVGADKTTTIIKPAQDTGSSDDARGWFLVNSGVTFNLSKVTLDGSGYKVFQAIRHKGSGTITDCAFKNIQFEPSGPAYEGIAIAAMGAGNVDITNCTFTGIGRIGAIYFGTGVTGSTFSNNTYVGKGAGDWLDYGVEVGGGAHATITGNEISNCTGVASVDGSTSAGILVTTYYGSGTQADISGNDIHSNTGGIAVGYDEYDTSVVVAHNNNIVGNISYGIDSTAPTVDATLNWWGSTTGSKQATTNPSGTGNEVSDKVDYSPWWGASYLSGTAPNIALVAHPWTWHTNDSIQEAINAAGSGDTINVAAGTYDEQVVIDKSLTLQGAGETTVVKPSSVTKFTQVFNGLFWYGDTKQIAGIIVAKVSDGDNVTIKNLKVDESSITTKPIGADYLTGIFYRETGGAIDMVNIVGTGAWSGGDRAYGMYLSAATNTVAIEVKGSTITNFDKEGINVEGNALTVNIHHNTISGRGSISDEVQNGVDIGRDAVGTVNYNTISNLVYQSEQWWSAGIMFYSYVSPTGKSATAIGNIIDNCQIGIIFKNVNGVAQGNTVNGGTVGLIGIYAEPNALGAWTASFVGNTVSGAKDDSYCHDNNAAIGANTYHSVSPGASLTVTIDNNQLLGGGSTDADGISIGVGGADGSYGGSIVATIKNNTISNWQYGVRLDGANVNAASSSANANNIVGNQTYGIYNGGSGTLDATLNWWDNSSGPSGIGSGEGDAVSTSVNYNPWLLEPKDEPQTYYDHCEALKSGWNLISTPKILENENLSELIVGATLEFYTYDGNRWINTTSMKPLDAVFVKMGGSGGMGFEWTTNERVAPPTKPLDEGWNLVGSSVNIPIENSVPVDEALDSVSGSWSTVFSPACNLRTWTVTTKTAGTRSMLPYEGYWVYMLMDDELAGRTV